MCLQILDFIYGEENHASKVILNTGHHGKCFDLRFQFGISNFQNLCIDCLPLPKRAKDANLVLPFQNKFYSFYENLNPILIN